MRGKAVGLLVALLLVAAGGFLTFFGLGASGGATSRTWAILGPLLGGFGLALGFVILRSWRR